LGSPIIHWSSIVADSHGADDESTLDQRIRSAAHDAALVHPVRGPQGAEPSATFTDACRRLDVAVRAYAVQCRAGGLAPEAMVIAVKTAALPALDACRDQDVHQDLLRRIVRCATESYYRGPTD
jgi:hypothetical protein